MNATSPKPESNSNTTSKPKRKFSFSVKVLLLLVTLAVLGIVGKQQRDRHQNRKKLVGWIRQSQPSQSKGCPDSSLSKKQVLSLLVDGAVSLEYRFQRTYCLKLLAEQYPEDAKEPFVRIALHSNDETVQAAAVHLVTLCCDETVLPRLRPLLKNERTSESVKCAILDCIGFAQCRAYEIEGLREKFNWVTGTKEAMLNSYPRILISNLAYSHIPRTLEKGSNQKGELESCSKQDDLLTTIVVTAFSRGGRHYYYIPNLNWHSGIGFVWQDRVLHVT